VSGQLYDPAALSTGKNSSTQQMGGLLGPKITLDILEKKKQHIAHTGFKTPDSQESR
jgi:hypothetical protein